MGLRTFSVEDSAEPLAQSKSWSCLSAVRLGFGFTDTKVQISVHSLALVIKSTSTNATLKRKKMPCRHLLYALRLFAAPIPVDVLHMTKDPHITDMLEKYNATQASVAENKAKALKLEQKARRLENDATKMMKECEQLTEMASDLHAKMLQAEEDFFERYPEDDSDDEDGMDPKRLCTAFPVEISDDSVSF